MKGSWKIAAFLCYVFLYLVLLFLPFSLQPGSYLPDDGDALQGAYVLGWVAHQLTNAPSELFDMNAYYPHPKGLVYQEHLIPQGLVVALLQKVGCDLILAYNLLNALVLVALAFSVRLWARQIGAGEIEAAMAGVVCTLTTLILVDVSRPQSISIFWIPLALFFLHRFFLKGGWTSSTALAACVVLQGLSSQYHLVSFPLFLALVIAGYAHLYPERRTARDALRLTAPLIAGAVLLVLIHLPYLKVFSQYGFDQPLSPGADLAGYFIPPLYNIAYGWLVEESNLMSLGRQYFVGYLAFMLAVAGIISLWRNRLSHPLTEKDRWTHAWLVLCGGVFVVLSAGPDVTFAGYRLGPGPFRLLHQYVPFFSYTRAPARFSVYFTFVFALLAGFGAGALTRSLGHHSRTRAAVIAIMLILLPLEHARKLDHATRIPRRQEIPAVYHWLGGTPEDFPVVEFPVYPRGLWRFVGYQTYFSTVHWKLIPFGKPSFTPPGMEYLQWVWRHFPSRESTRLLQSLGVKLIIFHPHQSRRPRNVIQRLRRDPNYTFIRGFPDAVPLLRRLGYGNEVVFQVRPASRPAPPSFTHLQPIATDGWQFETSSSADPRLAVDGKLETGWSSEEPQQKGQYFEVNLGSGHCISKISLGFVFPNSEFPRNLRVNGYRSRGGWQGIDIKPDPWRHAFVVDRLVEDPADATMDLVLEAPLLLERIRLYIARNEPEEMMPKWRIPEIQIFEPGKDSAERCSSSNESSIEVNSDSN